jgi:hypothetical protein
MFCECGYSDLGTLFNILLSFFLGFDKKITTFYQILQSISYFANFGIKSLIFLFFNLIIVIFNPSSLQETPCRKHVHPKINQP